MAERLPPMNVNKLKINLLPISDWHPKGYSMFTRYEPDLHLDRNIQSLLVIPRLMLGINQVLKIVGLTCNALDE